MKHVNGKLQRDKHLVEAVVRNYGPISREGIHSLTQLRRSTTSQLVRELIGEGRLLEAGHIKSRTSIGRRQVLLQSNENYRFLAAVEFDDDIIQAGVLDLHPRLRKTWTEPANVREGREGLIKQLLACTRRVLEEASVGPDKLLGIGVADPGLVDSRRGVTVTSSTLEFWSDVPLKQIFEAEFGVPVTVESKTRAKAVAERILGAGDMRENMIYIDHGAGIGAGIIAQGELLYGEGCAAGEFGHTHIMEDGPACKCGSFGCLEAVAGTRAIEAKARKAMAEGAVSEIMRLAGRDPERITAAIVLEAAALGDKTASYVAAETGSYLGLGIANLVNLFNPGVVVLDHRLAVAGQEMLDRITRIVRRQALTSSTSQCEVRFACLGSEAGLLGTALLILNDYFEVPMLKPPQLTVEAGSAVGRRDAPAAHELAGIKPE